MKLITLHINKGLLERLDHIVATNLYPNRSEAIRFAIKDLVESEERLIQKIIEQRKKGVTSNEK